MSRWRAAILCAKLLQGGGSMAYRTSCSAAAAAVNRSPFQKPAMQSPAGLFQSLQSLQMGIVDRSVSMRPFSIGVPVSEVNKQESSNKTSKEQGLVKEKAFDDITDQIPHIVRPMGVVEGTSYGVLILAGLAFAAAVIWAVVNELLIQPLEYTCFNHTLKLLQDDPRVTVRLGTPVSGYGQESRNRQARQRIPHRIYKDAQGTEKVLVQFHAKGPSGNGRVTAEMYQDESKQWKHSVLHLDIENPVPQRISLVNPQYQRSFR